MPREKKFINDFSGGLNNQSDPKDIDDNQHQVSLNIDYSKSGQIRFLGNPSSVTEYDSVNTNVISGKGLFAYNSPYAVQSLTSGGADGMSLNVQTTTNAAAGGKSVGSIAFGGFEQLNYEMQMDSPIGLSGFMYDATNFNQSVTTCDTMLGTGVLVNFGSGYNVRAETIVVDTVDATSKFEIGDMVLNSSGVEVGIVTKVLVESIDIYKDNFSETESDSNGFLPGIRIPLANNEELYRSRSISCDADSSKLIVPGQRVHGAAVPSNAFITKVRHKNLAANSNFNDGSINVADSNGNWIDETIDSAANCTLTKDTGSNGWNGANSGKATLNATTGYLWYKMTDLVVGKEYHASVRASRPSSNDTISGITIGVDTAKTTSSNWDVVGENGTIVNAADKAVSRNYQVNFSATATTMYISLKITGSTNHYCYLDDFRVTSRWFVDRFEIDQPVASANTDTTLKFEKVLFHDLCVFDGFSKQSQVNYFGIPQRVTSVSGNQIGADIIDSAPNYSGLSSLITDLINGTNQSIAAGTDAATSSKHNAYGQNPEWSTTDNLSFHAFAGNVTEFTATDFGEGVVSLIADTVSASNNARMRISTYVNPIRYDCDINEKGIDTTDGNPSKRRKISDYRMYHKPSNFNLWKSNQLDDGTFWQYNKNICTKVNGYPGFDGFRFGFDGTSPSFLVGRQWSNANTYGGSDAVAQVSTITASGTVIAGDILTVTVNGDASAKQVSITADGTPTLTEMMTDSSGGLSHGMTNDAQIDALLTMAYNDSTKTITCTAKTTATPFDISWSLVSTITEYKDDRHLILVDADGYMQWNSTEGNYSWLDTFLGSKMWTNNTDMSPVFYADSGAVRICEANFNNTNNTKKFRYLDHQGLFNGHGGATVDIAKWVLNDQEVTWSHTQGSNGIRTDMYSAVGAGSKEMDVQLEVITSTGSNNVSVGSEFLTITYNSHGLSTSDQIDLRDASSGTDLPTELEGRYDIAEIVNSNSFKVVHTTELTSGTHQADIYPVGEWDGTYRFYASAYDVDGNETLPEHVFDAESSGVKEKQFFGNQLKFSVDADPGDVNATESNYIANWDTKGFRIYFSKSDDGYGQKWWLYDLDFKDGLVRADNSDKIAWVQKSGDSVKITGDSVIIKNPMEIDTFETLNGFSDTNTLLGARYKAIAINGRRAFIGNVSYGGRIYNDRMIVSPYNQLDVFPTPYGVIEVSTNDGQAIQALASWGDRILQFKQRHMYIINVASGEPSTFFLEAAHKFYGCKDVNHVVETPLGIIWANQSSVYLFDGEPDKIIDLFKYAPEDDIQTTGLSDDDRTTRRINITDDTPTTEIPSWNQFYNANISLGYEPNARMLMIKRNTGTVYQSGDTYIYNIDNDSWTYCKNKWYSTVKCTNFQTDLNDNLILITQLGHEEDGIGGDGDVNWGQIT